MKEAKHCYLLSNGISVVPDDRVELLTNDGKKYVCDIIDVSTKSICGKLIGETGEIDVYFEELEDIRIVK